MVVVLHHFVACNCIGILLLLVVGTSPEDSSTAFLLFCLLMIGTSTEDSYDWFALVYHAPIFALTRFPIA